MKPRWSGASTARASPMSPTSKPNGSRKGPQTMPSPPANERPAPRRLPGAYRPGKARGIIGSILAVAILMAVCAAVTARLLQMGYRHVHLYTEHWRLAALKQYLKLGYVPFLDVPEARERWQGICAQLSWPFMPEAWRIA